MPRRHYGTPIRSSPIDYRWGLPNDLRRRNGVLPIVHRWETTWRLATQQNCSPARSTVLVLRTLVRGPRHGYGIAERLKELSHDVLQVGESSLYPALQRLLLDGYVASEWGLSENNRRARYYTLTPAGRKHLAAERKEFERMVTAIQAVLEFA